MKYLVIYEESPEGFGAYCPELPGCVATASTLEECSELIEEAASFHIAGLKEDGLPIPTPKEKKGDILMNAHGVEFPIEKKARASQKKYLHQ